jgi:hypothetical protein
MINEGHVLGLCITLEDFPKSKVCDHPNCYTESFAFKGRRNEEIKEIERTCGMA